MKELKKKVVEAVVAAKGSFARLWERVPPERRESRQKDAFSVAKGVKKLSTTVWIWVVVSGAIMLLVWLLGLVGIELLLPSRLTPFFLVELKALASGCLVALVLDYISDLLRYVAKKM